MLPSELISSLPKRFESARDSRDLIFYPSTISEHVDSGIHFQVTLCPALQKKPQPAILDEKKMIDPFAPPYNLNLYLGDLQSHDQEEYIVLLNKFSIVPEHFLLAAKEYRSQSSPLMPSELGLVYQLLTAAKKAGKNFLAFYNCGNNSGASQSHKHIQLIPVGEDGPPVEMLARAAVLEVQDKPFSITNLPYANHVCRFPPRLSSFPPENLNQTLSRLFLSLLDLGVSTIRHDPDYPPGKSSYNVIISLEHMYLIPRRQNSYTLPGAAGILAINSLGYAGMLLVKSDKELDAAVREGIGKILQTAGLKSVHEEQVLGTEIDP